MNDDSSLGACPHCGASLTASQKLIEWEKDDGSLGVFADCDECDEVVRPE